MNSRVKRVGLCDAAVAEVRVGKHQASVLLRILAASPIQHVSLYIYTVYRSFTECLCRTTISLGRIRQHEFRAVQLIEHQHRRHRQWQSVVRVYIAFRRLMRTVLTADSGNTANQAASQPQSSGGLFGPPKISTPGASGGGLFGASTTQSQPQGTAQTGGLFGGAQSKPSLL
jgi:hypothetical protein